MRQRRFLWTILGSISVGLFLLSLWGLATVAQMARELPNPEDFASRRVTQSTKIYDRTGETLLFEIHDEERRTVIPPGEVPEYAKQATLAIEDQGFYDHKAISWRSIVRAFFTNLIKGRFVQGGSTITQQLAKNAFLTPERTISRKLRELILAYWIEKKYGKEEILNLYLNQIPYGANAYGLEAASQTYFGKSAKDISLAEAAVLAAMLKAPTYYSPWGQHRDELESRKKYVLGQMEDLGYIDNEERLRAEGTELTYLPPSAGSIMAPHFVMMVRDYLNQKYGEDLVERGGLKVITTLDVRLQEIAERVVREGAERNSNLYNGRNAALVAEDPKTGQILALVGSKNYFGKPEPAGCREAVNCQFEGNFNVASQGKRQPGSSIKPIAYITALKGGYTPQTILFDLPTEFSTRPDCPLLGINYFAPPASNCFHPENFDGRFRGPIDLRHALAQSVNVPSVKVLYLAGLDEVLATARDFGITTFADPSRYGLSLVLGGGEVRLSEMVHAYAVLAQEGKRRDQRVIAAVRDADGALLEEYADRSTQVIDPQYARMINDILSDGNARAPLFGASSDLTTFADRDVALKTGTTNDYRDAWSIGYTPSLVVGVWAGNNDNRAMQKRAGSILAAVPIWSAFLKEALPLYPEEAFAPPDPVVTAKPILDGNVAPGELHSILYSVSRDDPMGPPPQNPSDDPQFSNWELPIRAWGETEVGRAFLLRASAESTSPIVSLQTSTQ